jgi:GNAT superfamily N-acetyltransferase
MGDRIVASVSVYPRTAKGNEDWLSNAADIRRLAVDVRFHGEGIGGPMLDAAEKIALRSKARAICLHVRRGATGLAKMYEDRGYIRDPRGDRDLMPKIFLECYAKEILQRN